MGNNVAGNLTATRALLRRITRSAAKWVIKEGPRTLPEGAIEHLAEVAEAQSAGSAGVEGSSFAASAPVFGLSVTTLSLLVAVLLGIVGWVILAYRLPAANTPATTSTDHRPAILSAEQVQSARERQKGLEALQESVSDHTGSTENTEVSRELLALSKEVTPLPRPTIRQPNKDPDFAVQKSDATAIVESSQELPGSNEMDRLGYMVKGQAYFADRPGAWEHFKKRNPEHKDLTWSALEASERAENTRKALRQALADNLFELKTCSTKEVESQAKCVAEANKTHASRVAAIKRE